MDVNYIINKIKLEQEIYSDADLAELFKVSPSAVSNWKQREKMPLSIIQRYCKENNFLVDSYLNKKSFLNTTSTIEETSDEEDNMDYQYVVQLQKEKIEILENKLKSFMKVKTPESTHWDELAYHFQTEVELHFSGFGILGRTVKSVDNIKTQSRILGYSVQKLKELWDVGVRYENMESHKINLILHKETEKELRDVAKTLPTVFNTVKDMIGSHYIPTKLMYKCKNNSFVGAISYNKVKWLEQKVISKIAFLIDE